MCDLNERALLFRCMVVRLCWHCEAWRSFLQLGKDFVEKGIFAAHFAAAKWAYNAAKWHSCAKGWFRSCETPFEMAHRLRNSRSALRVRLQMAITFSFHLQIEHRLKLWTPDFLSFETRYSMPNFSSMKCSKTVSNSSKMGCDCDISALGVCTVVLILIIQKPILHQNKLKLKH